MYPNDALVLTFSRNVFYRRLHFLALAALALNIIVIGALVWTLVYLLKNPVKPLYFATDDVSRLVKIVPVTEPNMSLEEVTNWVSEAVEAAYSYDFTNYREQLQNAQKYFTTYGWSEYMKALSLSGNLRSLSIRKQIVQAQVINLPNNPIRKIMEGNLSSDQRQYAWKFELPVLITYSMPPYDGSNQFQNALTVTVLVRRLPILQGYMGLGVEQMVSAMATTAVANPVQTISNTATE
jgi:intracellular multiplication protein IcmL